MKSTTALLLPALLWLTMPAWAGGPASDDHDQAAAQAKYEAMRQEAERAREEAQAARNEAARVAERVREVARRRAELARRQAEPARAAERKELARTREELARTHRELREATREVARAHRELARTAETREIVRMVNLGDRPVIGIVLGGVTDQGIRILGVSPDGPAERAGLQAGDVLVSIAGESLTGGSEAARETVYRVMSESEDGEELAVVINRDGENIPFTVVAERREPTSWQTIIRIPDTEDIAAGPGEAHVWVDRIEVPEIDEEALAEQIEELGENLKTYEFKLVTQPGEKFQAGDGFRFPDDLDGFDIEIEDYSDLAEEVLREANIHLGLPHSTGLELATLNPGLGTYFKADRGVLVLRASEDNKYRLESGDVVLSIGSTPVNSPGDVMRLLRDLEPGSTIQMEIKRHRRNKTLEVEIPETDLRQAG